MINNNFNRIVTYDNFLGKKTIGGISPIPNTPWFSVIEIPEHIATTSLFSIMVIFISEIIIVGLTVFEIALFFSKSITKPINELNLFTKNIVHGNLAASITHSKIKELSDLSHSFQVMQNHLMESTRETETAYSNLKLSEQKFRDLYEHSPTLLRTVDLNGKILNCNERYAVELGYTKEELLNTSIFDHVPNNQLDKARKVFDEWKRIGRIGGIQLTLKRKDNTTFDALLFASGVYDSLGHMIGSNTSIIDLTELNQVKREILDEKLKRLTSIGELSARIAHDLRNPMSVLKNTFELLELDLREVQTDSIKNKIQRIERAITRINHQVENVLDYVKEKPLKLENVSINSLLSSVVERINVPVNITINLPKNDLKVKCDFEKMEIVFINLITNAIQVMSNNGEINVRSKYDGDNCLIDVEDNGPGIPPEHIKKIFDPLFTTRQIGTGLGLPSCKTIVEAHKGKIDVISSLGKGTLFRIEFPKNLEQDRNYTI